MSSTNNNVLQVGLNASSKSHPDLSGCSTDSGGSNTTLQRKSSVGNQAGLFPSTTGSAKPAIKEWPFGGRSSTLQRTPPSTPPPDITTLLQEYNNEKENTSSNKQTNVKPFSEATFSEQSVIINNANLMNKFEQMENLIAKLNNEVTFLKKENLMLRETVNKTNNAGNSTTMNNQVQILPINEEFHTSSDELERETSWVIQKTRRANKKPRKDTNSSKRKAESSPEVESIQTQIKTNNAITVSKVNEPERKKQVPPPINILGITNHASIQKLMKEVVQKDYKVISLSNNTWKINTTEPEDYKALANKLNADGQQWYTYEDKNDRSIKVMARGLHPTCSKDEIIEDLQSKGLKIIDAVNIIKKERRENREGNLEIIRRGLPLFMLTFEKQEKIENIYNIKAILNLRVKIETPRKVTRLIPQCKKCQDYNHTQKYCHREARCVKCAGKHAGNDCTVPRNITPKCINCKGEHPANYRGCEVAIELQKMRDKLRKPDKSRNKQPIKKYTEPKSATVNFNLQRERVNESVTYAQIVQQTEQKHLQMDQVLQDILKNLENLNKRLISQEMSLQNTLEEMKTQTSFNKKVEENLDRVYQNINYIKSNYKPIKK